MPQQESRKTRRPYPVRFAPEELAQIRLQADVAGVPVSTYIRDRALGRRLRVTTGPRQQYLLRQRHIMALRELGDRLGRLWVASGGDNGAWDRTALAGALTEIRLAAWRIERAAE